MTTYRDSGVDQDLGDSASSAAYTQARTTFASRTGLIGCGIEDDGGFTGMLDMGDYMLVQNADGTGSKMSLGVGLKKYDTLGYDLLAMVADDAIVVGAEVLSVSNTMDIPNADPKIIDAMMAGHAKACREQKIIIPGGEIAQLPGIVSEPVWNATAVGIVAKDRILKPETIRAGDVILTMRSAVARSNGFSLIRKILSDKFGDAWMTTPWKEGKSWGEIMLTPSIIYHAALLTVLGRYGEKRTVEIKGLAHVTGGGIPGNLPRILKHAGVGAELTDLWPPHPALQDLVTLGKVPLLDAYETWNMGTGMFAVVAPDDEAKITELLTKQGIQVRRAGTITKGKSLSMKTYTGDVLNFDAATGDVQG